MWRSDDGTTWTRVTAPGFGTPEAHRVESLQVFQNGLYAYVSHVGGTTAGADVWRCIKTICAEEGDWTQVVTNGFGVPQNQYLYTGAVSGGYLYGAVDNSTTGMQLWRTANGSDWEKATPYDGFGNSNNRYVSNHAMTVFNERLTLGVTNWTNGVGIWQKTLTADFTATPHGGAPPLTVQFTQRIIWRLHVQPVGLRGWRDEHGGQSNAHVHLGRDVRGDVDGGGWDGHEYDHEAGVHRGEAFHVSTGGAAELRSAAV